MADALATSIISKLTNWYPCDGDLNDAHGTDDLVSGVVNAGYEAGYGTADQLIKGSRAYATLGSAIAFANNSGNMTIGGLFDYDAGTTNTPEWGYSYGGISAGDEAFKIVTHIDGYFYVTTWEDVGITPSYIADPLEGATNHPVTLRVTDTEGATASSNQIIRIEHPGALQPGRYFVVATWAAGIRKLYIENILVVTSGGTPAAVKAASIPRLEIGRAYSAVTCITGQQNLFACAGAALTADEINYIYNGGAYRDYATILAAS